MENSNPKKSGGKKSRKWPIYVLVIAVIIIIILLLLRSCGTQTQPPVVDTTPQGSYEVGGRREDDPVDTPVKNTDTITFSGTGSCTVSAEKPDAEFFNPEINIVDFIFTITDTATGEVVARTDKVSPGKYVYVNLYDFYKAVGEYDVTVSISTFTADGQQMNGVNQKMVVKVIQ